MMERQVGNIKVRMGEEGPKHDPYSFTEYETDVNGHRTVFHFGALGSWLKIGHNTKIFFDHQNHFPHSVQVEFERLVGRTIESIDDELNRPPVCPDHPEADTISQAGYPGESFECCSVCGKVVDTHFNRSAVE